jgi:hypothetical protein
MNFVKREKNSKVLTLDEKIQRLRAELKLPEEKPNGKLIERLQEFENHLNEEKKVGKIEVAKSRVRSKSAKPSWKPTGGDVYTRPHTELVVNRKKEDTKECEPIINRCEPVRYCYEPQVSAYSCLPPPLPPAQSNVQRTVYQNWDTYCRADKNSGAATQLPAINQSYTNC